MLLQDYICTYYLEGFALCVLLQAEYICTYYIEGFALCVLL